jgi:hypothetical protein
MDMGLCRFIESERENQQLDAATLEWYFFFLTQTLGTSALETPITFTS